METLVGSPCSLQTVPIHQALFQEMRMESKFEKFHLEALIIAAITDLFLRSSSIYHISLANTSFLYK